MMTTIDGNSPEVTQRRSEKTEVGSYFVSNYPPFSLWNPSSLLDVKQALEAPPADVPLGLYLHIPFCRKRCKFCYFRVYVDKRADEIETYLAAMSAELALIREFPCRGDRPVRFVYFGGGTPSFLSTRQLTSLFARLRASVPWDRAEEVTFECEPGTLSESKVHALADLGVTRLSLGIENFDDTVLRENGRAHLSQEIERSWQWIQSAGFPQVNVDLIAGMVGETWENWRSCIQKAMELQPDSITMYQMELPFNTVYSQELLGRDGNSLVADWQTKREWVSYAMDALQSVGYSISSAYTMVRDASRVHFQYRDHLWQGADLLAAGVASFGHVSGVHYQNHPDWAEYVQSLHSGVLPLYRGLRITPHQALVREAILQLKRGWLDARYFREKFGVEVLQVWPLAWEGLVQEGMVEIQGNEIRLTRAGLLRVDALLPRFFEAEHRGLRYT